MNYHHACFPKTGKKAVKFKEAVFRINLLRNTRFLFTESTVGKHSIWTGDYPPGDQRGEGAIENLSDAAPGRAIN